MSQSNLHPSGAQAIAIPASGLEVILAVGWGIREADELAIALTGSSTIGGAFAPVVSVRFLKSAEAPSLSLAAAGIVTGLGTALNDLRILEGAEAELSAGPAHRIVATCRQGIFELALDHILIDRSDGILLMGLTCLTSDYPDASRDLDAMAASVRISTGT